MSHNPYSTPPVHKGFQSPQSMQPLPQGMAVTAMVCGILSLTLCGCFTGIPAAICGWIGMKQADRGEAGGKGMAVAGLIMGIVNLVLTGLVVLFYIAIFGLAIASEM